MSTAIPETSASPAAPLPRRRALTSQDAGMLLVCLIWGMNFSVTKSAFDQLAPLPFTAIRFVVSSALLWIIIRVTEGSVSLPRRALGQLVILGVVGNTLYQLAFMLGLARTTATNSALILSTVPTVVSVLAGGLGLERIT